MAHPSDPSAAAQVFVSAYHAAASATAERARLQESSQQQMMQHQIERERIGQSAREAEARLAVETQYHQQQAELRQRELQQEEKKAAMTAQVAFQKYRESQAQREMTRRFQSEQQDKREGAIDKRQRTALEARSLQGQASANKPIHVGNKLIDPNTGEVLFDANSDRVSDQDKMKFSRASKEMQEANAAMAHPWISADANAMTEWKKKYEDAKAAADGVTAKYQKKQTAAPEAPAAATDQFGMPSGLGLSGSNLAQPRLSIPGKGGTLSIGGAPATPAMTGTTPAPAETAPADLFPPAPVNPKDREKDTTYQTPKGPHTWTGENWVPYTPPSHDEEQAATETPTEPAAPDQSGGDSGPDDEAT